MCRRNAFAQPEVNNKSVFPVVSNERRENYTYYEDSRYLDSKIQPITMTEYQGLIDRGYSVPDIVNEGTVLMRHPYRPNTLVDSNYTLMAFIQEKFCDYAVILNFLGATNQELDAKITKRQTREISAKGKIKCKTKFSLKGSFNRKTKEKSEVCFKMTIGGKEGRKCDAAEKYAKEVGLADDPFVRMVLTMQKQKPVKKIKVDIVVSKEFEDLIDAAATLSVMGSAFNLEGDFKKKVSTRDEISICQDLTFS